ncbi:hypothetical protein GCM10010911_04620 [Paenibacillus nasutitermitis]|uniref:Uncharacterized protein n=1 Tax=Paenibacillus nasutitermitis TaxID=1652958 RepID=A0A917DM10_9BACL|nr:hypothetical protein GCM10010911_04620 [Paenibacillus nasutitermitis]
MWRLPVFYVDVQTTCTGPFSNRLKVFPHIKKPSRLASGKESYNEKALQG